MNINNAKTNAFQRRRNRLSKSILGPLGGAFCIPERTMTAVRKRAGGPPHSGFHVTQVIKESLPTPRARYGNNVANMPGLGLLGEGKNGTVYLGYWGPSSGGNPMAIKIGDHESVNREAKVLKEFKGISPHIPALYLHKSASECKTEAGRRGGANPLINSHVTARNGEPQSIMYSEYASGGNIESFFGKFGGLMGADDIKAMAFQVLWTLDAMQKKMPSFRHGDMIMANIMVDVEHHDRGTIRYRGGYTVPNRGFRLMVGDFGLAHGSKDGMKAAPLAHLQNSHGIGPNVMKGYDAHLFLVDFATFLRDHPKAGEFKAFVKKVIPAKYNCAADQKKFNSDHLVGGRLRHGLGSDIPSISQMLSTSYFAEFKKPRYVSKGEWPRAAHPLPKVPEKAAPSLQRAQVVKMNNLIQAAKNMGYRDVSKENKARAKAMNALIKTKSPKLRSAPRKGRKGARSPVDRREMAKRAFNELLNNLNKPAEKGSTINLTKPSASTGSSRVQNLFKLVKSNKATNAQLVEFVNLVGSSNRLTKTQRLRLPDPSFLSDPKVLKAIEADEKREAKELAQAEKAVRSKANVLANALGLNENETKKLTNQMVRDEMQKGKKPAKKAVRLPAPKGSKLPEHGKNADPGKFYKNWFSGIPRNDYKSVMSKLTVADLKYLAESILSSNFKRNVAKQVVVKKGKGAQAASKGEYHKAKTQLNTTFNKSKKADLLMYFSSAKGNSNLLASNNELGNNNNNKVASPVVKRTTPKKFNFNNNNELAAAQKFFRSMNKVASPKTKMIAPKQNKPKKLTKEQKAMYANMFKRHEENKKRRQGTTMNQLRNAARRLDAAVKKTIPPKPKKVVVRAQPKGKRVSMMGEIAKMAKRDRGLKVAQDKRRVAAKKVAKRLGDKVRARRAARGITNANIAKQLEFARQQRLTRIEKEIKNYEEGQKK
jgi:hypothetical protein